MGVNFVIYFYMFICLALLVFNVVYILRSKEKQRRQSRRVDFWLRVIGEECRSLERGTPLSSAHGKRLEKRLVRLEELMAYQEAVLICFDSWDRELTQRYLDAYHLSFQVLAVEYSRRPAMERAFYAYLMGLYHPYREQGGGRLVEVLMTYFDDSTVFCRENVLQALYAMGQASAVEQAFTLMSERGWYHHTRLLSDGLSSFAGDKVELAQRLWRRCTAWTEALQVAVVQFATDVSDSFSEEFLFALQDDSLPLETRFALLRYFQRRVYLPARALLLELLEQGEANGLSITAAAALSRYPGEDTRQALFKALHSWNWYVRRNAASSLVAMGAAEEDARALREGGDRYAAEMLDYMLEERASKEAKADKKEAVEVGI
ncbi:MAG: HEAT repeat domain-containing protein [Oscillibacter sp.]|nr:HEAT repeat domain-containing protein [Oscillibacter sp.]